MADKKKDLLGSRVSQDLSTIVRAAIHPALGIARVGNSTTDLFCGPEVDRPAVQPPGFYRDTDGALKRQAARFRIYGYDAQGNVVAELTGANAQIGWSVHLANLKGAWYEFHQALDIPESAGPDWYCPRRNAGVVGANRSQLAIDGGQVNISGQNTPGGNFQFNGAFLGAPVYLGELRTDKGGRLLVLGGLGRSFSPTNTPLSNSFANSDGWCDDTADGPVTATLMLNGNLIPVDPAWVVVAPPNYAPNLKTVRTMYDLLVDLFCPVGLRSWRSVSFTSDVLPIFERMSGLQWTNFGFARAFGHGAPLDFGSPAFIARAAASSRDAADHEWCLQIANAFRNPDRDGYSPTPLPWMYSDAINLPPPHTDNVYLSLTPTQLDALEQWALGNFVADYDPSAQPPGEIGDVPPGEQPAMLDRAALEFCLADAFHPGCELTWPMRHKSMYMAPFRIRQADPTTPAADYGDCLTPEIALKWHGPLWAQRPGGLTRWMAVPWQTDTASCLSGYIPEYDPYLPTFWPARVPNHVLDEPEYQVAIDGNQPREARIAAFQTRKSWPDVLPGRTHEEKVVNMVPLFGLMGIAEVRPGVPDDPDLPAVMQVTKLPFIPPPWEPGPVIPPSALAKTTVARPAAPRVARPPRIAPSVDGTYMGRFRRRSRDPEGR